MYQGLLQMIPAGVDAAQGNNQGRFAGMVAGGAVGALLAPFTGGASIGIGASLGGSVGSGIEMGQKKKAHEKKVNAASNFRSLYADSFNKRQNEIAQQESRRAINDRLSLGVY